MKKESEDSELPDQGRQLRWRYLWRVWWNEVIRERELEEWNYLRSSEVGIQAILPPRSGANFGSNLHTLG